MVIDMQPTVFALQFVGALFNNSIVLCCGGEMSSLDHLPSDTIGFGNGSRGLYLAWRDKVGCTMSLNIILFTDYLQE